MKEFAIIRKEEAKIIFIPNSRIPHSEFINLVNRKQSLTWYEETDHGKRSHRLHDLPKKIIAYINYDSKEAKRFVKCQFFEGTLLVTFENRLNIDILKEWIIIANELDSNLCSRKRRKIVELEYYEKKYLKKK